VLDDFGAVGPGASSGATSSASPSASPLPALRLDASDFELFGLPAQHALDRTELDATWRRLQTQVHPDRFAAQGAAAQRLAMQWAVRVNEAYRRLKDPLQRAALLCEQRGAPIEAERNTAMPPAFLMRQMQWREALDEAADSTAVQQLDDEVAAEQTESLALLTTLLDARGDAPAAAAQVRALMFVARFRSAIAQRLEALDSH
jgi:molecular chaperone HscB